MSMLTTQSCNEVKVRAYNLLQEIGLIYIKGCKSGMTFGFSDLA